MSKPAPNQMPDLINIYFNVFVFYNLSIYFWQGVAQFMPISSMDQVVDFCGCEARTRFGIQNWTIVQATENSVLAMHNTMTYGRRIN